MRRVNHHRQSQLFGKLQLRAKVFVLKRGLFVVAEFTDGNDTLFQGIARQDLQHGLCKFFVVGLFWIETDGAVVAKTKLAGPEALEATNQRKVVDVTTDVGARLAEPKRRFDAGNDAGRGHALIVVGGAGNHMRMGIEKHEMAPVGANRGRCRSSGCSRLERRHRDRGSRANAVRHRDGAGRKGQRRGLALECRAGRQDAGKIFQGSGVGMRSNAAPQLRRYRPLRRPAFVGVVTQHARERGLARSSRPSIGASVLPMNSAFSTIWFQAFSSNCSIG